MHACVCAYLCVCIFIVGEAGCRAAWKMEILLCKSRVFGGKESQETTGDELALNCDDFYFFLKAKQFQGKGLQKSPVSGGNSIEFLVPGCLPGGPLVTSTFFQQGRRRNWQQPSRQAVREAGKPDALPPSSLPLVRPKSQRVQLLNFSIFVFQCSWSDPAGIQWNKIMPDSQQGRRVRTEGFVAVEG